MPAKRFSLTDAQAKGNFTKRMRMEQGLDGQAALIAVARPWGSAFWVFEGETQVMIKQCQKTVSLSRP